jgi:hypothetical protein
LRLESRGERGLEVDDPEVEEVIVEVARPLLGVDDHAPAIAQKPEGAEERTSIALTLK